MGFSYDIQAVTTGPDFYQDLAYVFAAALAGGLVMRKLKQPLIVGYVVAGIVVGPFTPGPQLSHIPTLSLLAEIGVILLMFSIGVEFSFQELLSVKRVALIGAPIGIALCLLMGALVGYGLGWPLTQGLAVGALICVASTMVMSRLLIDSGRMETPEARMMIGITLVEDLAVVFLIVLLPSLGSNIGHRLRAAAFDIGKALLILIPIIFLATRWVPRLLSRVLRMNNPELYILVVLALSFTTAAVTHALGLSLALGAFLAGMMVSKTGAHETMGKLQPLRDAFVALFFVTIGALIDPRTLFSSPGLLATFVGLIVVGKALIWTGTVRALGYPLRTASAVATGLTQIGEFSYVLAQVALQAGLIDNNIYNVTLAASLITILLNAALMRLTSRLYR
jgi:monovalent cation:H+ antiporter-2, CPA2 family